MSRSQRLLLSASVLASTACVTGSVVSQSLEEDARSEEATIPAPMPAPAAEVAMDEGVAYYGAHPIPAALGGGWCLIDGPHLHAYEPDSYGQFVLQNDFLYFGLNFADWLYFDRHPVPPDEGGGWCGLDGYHHHIYRPWDGFLYDPSSGAYLYNPERAPVVTVVVTRPSRTYRAPPRVVRNVARPAAGPATRPSNVMHRPPPSTVPVPAPRREVVPETIRPAPATWPRSVAPATEAPAPVPVPAPRREVMPETMRPPPPAMRAPAVAPPPAREPPPVLQPNRFQPIERSPVPPPVVPVARPEPARFQPPPRAVVAPPPAPAPRPMEAPRFMPPPAPSRSSLPPAAVQPARPAPAPARPAAAVPAPTPPRKIEKKNDHK